MIDIAIIGGGKGGTSILNAFIGIEGFRIIGICDINPDAPGLKLAKLKEIPIYNDLNDILSHPKIDVIIEATGVKIIRELISAKKQESTKLIDSDIANLVMTFTEAHDKVLKKITVRQAAEEALRKTQQQMANIIEFLPDATFVINLEGEVIAWNKAIEYMTGVKAEDILGKRDWEYSVPFYGLQRPMLIDMVNRPNAELKKQYISFKTENKILTAEGMIKVNYGSGEAYGWGQAAPLYDNEGSIVGAIESFRDITGYKKTENALRDSERNLNDIINFLPDATFVINLEGKVIAWNKAIEQMTGVKADEILGEKDYSIHFYNSHRPMLIDLAIRPNETDEKIEAQYSVFRRENGTIIAEWNIKVGYGRGVAYVWGKATALYNEQGHIVGAIESFRDISDMKKNETALRRSRQRLAEIIDFLPDATFAVDKWGRVIAWNKAIERITCVKAKDIVGEGNLEYSIPFYGSRRPMIIDLALNPNPENEKLFPSLKKKRDQYTYEGVIRDISKKRSTYFWGQAAPLYDEKGEIIGAIESLRDMTEIKEMEFSLKQSEQRMSDIINLLPDATFVIDIEGKVISWNKAMEELTGLLAEDILGRGNDEYSIPFYSQKKPMLANLVLNPADKIDESRSIIHRDGGYLIAETDQFIIRGQKVYFWAKATPLYDSKGSIVGAIETVRDITELKKLEESLREQQELLQVTLASIGDAVIATDVKGNVTFINPIAEDLTGYTLTEAYLQPIQKVFNIINEETGKPAEIPTDRVIREGMIVGLANHTALIAKDKTEKSIADSAAPIRNKEGEIIGVVLVFRDVTESRQNEKQLEYLGFHDPLTGIYNRAFFEEEMNRLGNERFSPIGIIVCDVDGLKLINDSFGHLAGDNVLKSASEIIKRSFRGCDVVARIGGDEFAILLPDTPKEQVEEGYTRINKFTKQYNRANPELPVNISVGYSVSTEEMINIEELFKDADNNMYREKLHRNHSSRSAIVQTLMKTLEARDIITRDHSERIQNIVIRFAKEVKLSNRSINDISLLARFHDIGKVGIPDRILLKPGPLTPLEKEEMQRHCEIGYRIALSAPDLVPIADWVLRHHEWWNGKGYPLNLKGEEVPIECRLVAIVDAYEAMTSDRPYRKAMSSEQAIKELERCAGTQFDPILVKNFIKVITREGLV